MRTVKLIIIFILIVGNIVLLLNIDKIFGSKQYNHEPSEKANLTTVVEPILLRPDVEAGEDASKRDIKKPVAEKKETVTVGRDQARDEILELVRIKDLKGCRNHPGWNKHLSDAERFDINAVLDMGKKYKNMSMRKVVKTYLTKKVFNGNGITWDVLKEARKGIIKIESNFRNGYSYLDGVE